MLFYYYITYIYYYFISVKSVFPSHGCRFFPSKTCFTFSLVWFTISVNISSANSNCQNGAGILQVTFQASWKLFQESDKNQLCCVEVSFLFLSNCFDHFNLFLPQYKLKLTESAVASSSLQLSLVWFMFTTFKFTLCSTRIFRELVSVLHLYILSYIIISVLHF